MRGSCFSVLGLTITLAATFVVALAIDVAGQGPGVRHREGFELASGVQTDEVDSAIRAQIERVKGLLAERQWGEALEGLRQLADAAPSKLTAIGPRRYVPLRLWCQRQLTALPPDALKLYRHRADPMAKQIYERGIAQRDQAALENVVDEVFASSYGDKALWALAGMALESAEYAAARDYLQQILPPRTSMVQSTTIAWSHYPDTTFNLARVRATLVLVSILEGSLGRAEDELREFAQLHPGAGGRLGQQEGPYAELLRQLLDESKAWPNPPMSADWTTFAGNPQRNKVAPAMVDVGAVAWRATMRAEAPDKLASAAKPRLPANLYPVCSGGFVFVNNGKQILAFDRHNGTPAWANTPVIYSTANETRDASSVGSGPARWASSQTVTVFRNLLLARMEGRTTGENREFGLAGRGEIVGLDLAAEGRLLWKIEPEDGWAFEGTPVADDHGVYVSMRRHDTRPRAFVACFSPDNGRLRWRTFVCSAEVPPTEFVPERLDGLLTLANETIYYNTNLGAVAAVDRRNGRIRWLTLYSRALRGDANDLAMHWNRSPNPGLLAGNTLFVAPIDSPRVFAFDAFGGNLLWQTGTELGDVGVLLGVAGDRLIAAGKRLYWISTRLEDGGHVKQGWPDGDAMHSNGRGLLTEKSLLWPTSNGIVLLDPTTAHPRRLIDLPTRGVTGGNLLLGPNQLLITSDRELTVLGLYGGKRNNH